MDNEWFRYAAARSAAIVCVASMLAACGPGGGIGGGEGPATLSPATADVPVGGSATFTLLPAQAADWTVEGVPSGNAAVGRITAIGVYTAPFVIPSPTTVTIGASVATNTATVRVVSRFIDDGAVTIGTCSASPCMNAVLAPDLNGDGLSDLVTADTTDGTMSVLMRNTPGTFFGAAVSIDLGDPTKASPQALAIGDFNDDTELDVVVADAEEGEEEVWALLGNGTGALPTQVPTVLDPARDPLSIAAGQFDADADLDVVIANFLTGSVSVLTGEGTGAFLEITTITTLNSQPLGVAVGDFNQDGATDLAVANSGSTVETVEVFLGAGDGTFPTREPYSIAGSPSAVVATDLNGDGFLDLAATTASNNRLTVLLNRGTAAGLQFEVQTQFSATGALPIAVVAADLNNDGFQDLAVVNATAETVSIYLGQGDGTAVASETYPVGNAPQSVAVGDFNGDDWPDLAVANSGDDTVTILRNRGS
jgi:hypothetical protein